MKEVIKAFLKDHISVTVAFLVADILIVTFYTISTNSKVEIIYPSMLLFSVYLIYFCYEFYQYYKMVLIITKLEKQEELSIKTTTKLQQYIKQSMMKLHSEYLNHKYETEYEQKEKHRFLSTWIHNIRTPITVQQLLLQRLALGKIETTQFVEEFQIELNRTEKQLNLILDMLRLDDFVKDYIPQKINLTETLQRVIHDNKRLFIYKGVYPKILVTKDIYVLSDTKWNDMLLLQIISNAVKYSIRNTKSCVIFDIKKTDQEVELIITDEGIGIPKSDLHRVWEPFFTGENGRKIKNSSGIGLYFVKQVCDKLGHKISIESKVGQGTTVKVCYLAKL